MPFDVSYRENDTQQWISFSGELAIEEIEASWTKRTGDRTRFEHIKYLIADYSGASMKKIGHADVKRGSVWARTASSLNPRVTLISILPGALEFGIGRMWAGLVGDIPWEMVFVRSQEECREYLEKRRTPLRDH